MLAHEILSMRHYCQQIARLKRYLTKLLTSINLSPVLLAEVFMEYEVLHILWQTCC